MPNLTAPWIENAEKFGSRECFDNCIVYCEECGDIKNKLYDSYYTDKNGNCFCCKSCAMDYYGINLVEV